MIPRQWREDFITSYVERYLPQQGIIAAPILLRRLCTTLAHQQGATINLSKLAGSLGIDGKYWLVQALAECANAETKPQEILEKIERNAQANPWAEANFLKRPFLLACQNADLM